MLDEALRSMGRTLCRYPLPGEETFPYCWWCPEIEVFPELMQYAPSTGPDAYCFKAFAEAMEIIPSLSENAGLNPLEQLLSCVTVMPKGEKTAGIYVRKGCI